MAAVLPGSAAAPAGEAFAAGVEHRTCPAELRERLFVAEEATPALLAALREDGLVQAVALSTCDRIEIFGFDADPPAASRRIAARMAAASGVEAGELARYWRLRQGRDAVAHLFAVAASLESAMIGEPQVLGQVRAAYRQSAAAGQVGPELERLMQAAFAAARRVRGETALGARAVSLVSAALQVARDIHGRLDGRAALFVGAGELDEMLAAKLRDAGVGRFLVADSLAARARATALRLNAHIVPLDGLGDALAEADIVLGALGRGRVVIDAAMVRAALRRRRQRPIFLIDAAVPGDVAPDVGAIDEVFLYGLDDLERVAREGRDRRDQEAAQARAILDAAIAEYESAAAVREAVPLVAALRGHFERARARLLAEQPGLDAEEATRLLVNRLLHAPTSALRELAAAGAPLAAQEELLARLFGLERPAGGRRNEESEP